jgi:hypothetical protein|nr:MAG TPA: hypothetical protein [Caudoviricetes sp.]
MKIRLLHAADYKGLANVQFPVEVEVLQEGYSLYSVSFDTIAAIPGWFFHEDDTLKGYKYCFFKDEVEVVDNVSRKDLLLSLVKEYGDAINSGNYESECGSIEAMLACHEEEKRLLKEITKMINDGV